MKAYFFFIFILVALTNCAQLPLSIERSETGHIRGEEAADPTSKGISLNKWINDEISKSLSINNDNLINNKEKLWKASLAKLSFMPVLEASKEDYFILTDWFSIEKDINSRIKIDVYIVGDDLTKDSLDIRIFIQELKNNNWIKSSSDNDVLIKIQNSIIDYAASI